VFRFVRIEGRVKRRTQSGKSWAAGIELDQVYDLVGCQSDYT